LRFQIETKKIPAVGGTGQTHARERIEMTEQATQQLNQYEAMFLVAPSGAAEPQAAIDLCRGIIERHGGQIIVIKRWDERKLAFEIKKQKRGTYVIAYFRAPGTAVAPIERDVNLRPREERQPWDRPDFNRPPRRGGDRDRDRDREDRGGDRGPRREEAAAADAGANKE
jgi:small subunit ribosomal protein S6